MNELMAKHTGQPVEQIERDMDRDRFMSAEEAKEYGLIDNVITHRGEIVEPQSSPRRPLRDRAQVADSLRLVKTVHEPRSSFA